MKECVRFDCHIHSHFSSDSFLSPERIVNKAISAELGAIAITDHNTIRGGIAAQKINQESLFIIPGAEIATEYGDLIGLFLSDEIHSRTFEGVLDEIRDQGGLAVLPHPFRRKCFPPSDLLQLIDIIEGINSRTSVQDNRKAQLLADELGKPVIAGSDAHTAFEIGCAWTSIMSEGDLEECYFRKEVLDGRTHLNRAHFCLDRRVTQTFSTCVKTLKGRFG